MGIGEVGKHAVQNVIPRRSVGEIIFLQKRDVLFRLLFVCGQQRDYNQGHALFGNAVFQLQRGQMPDRHMPRKHIKQQRPRDLIKRQNRPYAKENAFEQDAEQHGNQNRKRHIEDQIGVGGAFARFLQRLGVDDVKPDMRRGGIRRRRSGGGESLARELIFGNTPFARRARKEVPVIGLRIFVHLRIGAVRVV